MPKRKLPGNRYQSLIERIFHDRHRKGATEIAFHRDDIPKAAAILGLKLPKNLGDVIYALRFRCPLPASILATQPRGHEWVIEGLGPARYAFRLSRVSRILPNPQLITIKVPDATPEMIRRHAQSDEQALLAKLRYNRLVDIFLGIGAYSLQSHLRTTVKGIGQIEIDELYVGLDRKVRQYVVPVQAKGGGDKLSPVQTKQDLAWCAERFPNLICRPVSAQFMEADLIALFELTVENGEIRVVDEAHYHLVPAKRITDTDLRLYAGR